MRDQVRAWNRGPIEFYEQLERDAKGEALADFNSLSLHLAIAGTSEFFVPGQALIKLLVPPGSDMAALEHAYERFVVRLRLDGLRRRGRA